MKYCFFIRSFENFFHQQYKYIYRFIMGVSVCIGQGRDYHVFFNSDWDLALLEQRVHVFVILGAVIVTRRMLGILGML